MSLLQTLPFEFNHLAEREVNTKTIVTLVIASCIYYFILHPLYFGPFSHIPGPRLCKISWYHLAVYDVWLWRNYKITQWHQKYGPIVCVRPGEVSFADPSLMREIYGATGGYTKSDQFDNFIVYGERPVFATKPPAEHAKKRIRIASFYQKKSVCRPVMEKFVRSNATKVVAQIEKAIDAESTKNQESNLKIATVNAYPLFRYLAFDVVTGVQLGPEYVIGTIEKDCRERQMIDDFNQSQVYGPLRFNFGWLVSLASWILSALPQYASNFLVPRELRLCLNSEKEFAEWSWRVTETATENPATINENSLLHHMLNFHKKDGVSLRFSYIAAELFDISTAGVEAVASGLIYLAFHMSRQPQWQRRVREELQSLPRDIDGYPSFPAIDTLPLFEAFVREVFRINPSASSRGERQAKKGGQTFNGIYIPQDTGLTACANALHRDPRVFPSPDEFLPQRWIDQDPVTLKRMEKNSVPFGYGARGCPGRFLGLMELKLVVGFLLLRYEFEATAEMGDGKTGPMWQSATTEGIPLGLRGDLVFKRL